VTFLDSSLPLSEEAIVAVEKRVGVPLPTEYRTFLLRQNGGRPKPADFRFGSRGESTVQELYAVNNSKSGLLAVHRDFHGLIPRMPKDILAIGCDPGGNQLCIATSGANAGSIYFWDHEKEGGFGHRVHYDNLHIVASTFSTFLDGLFETSPEEMATVLAPFEILRSQDLAALERLLEEGFGIDTPLSSGLTFLEHAAGNNRLIIARYLLDHGCAIGDAEGIALRARNFEMLNLIRSRKPQ